MKGIHEVVQETSTAVQSLRDDSRRERITAALPYAEGSSFDDASVPEQDAGCLSGTRTEVRRRIQEWAVNPQQKCMFWVNGMAGTGKSTISRTIAEYFERNHQLGASFFFKRGEHDRGNAKKFFTTICRQLLHRVPALWPYVERAVRSVDCISGKLVSEQFRKLILEPLSSLHPVEPATIVIVIDALDECSKDEIEVILKLLPHLRDVKSMCIRIFLTSRPEESVRLALNRSDYEELVLHEVPESEIEHDIRLFVEEQFRLMRQRKDLSEEWPAKESLDALIKMAIPLFIFAATSCRFIQEAIHPEDRLQSLLELRAIESKSHMDQLYLSVLNQLLLGSHTDSENVIKEFQNVVGVIINLAIPLTKHALAQLVNLPEQRLSQLLAYLRSVIHIPSEKGASIRILHKSFRDYLLATTSDFHVDEQETNHKIALHCLRVMKDDEYGLKRNICGLSSYGTQKVDIDRQTVDQHLSAALQYSCRYWIYHLQQGKGHVLEREVLPFLEKHFLHWLEALSLMGIMSEAVGMIDMLQGAVSVSLCSVHTLMIANMENAEGHRKDCQLSL
jgi:hypothetical protein